MLENKPFLSVRETADLVGVHRNTIYQLVLTGALPSAKIGRRRIVTRAAIDRFIKEQTEGRS